MREAQAWAIFAGITLTALGWKQGVGPLLLLTRWIIYIRALGRVIFQIAAGLPEEFARLWEPALARARREI